LGSYREMNCADVMSVIAVDPGLSGGIACWREGQPVAAYPMPPTEGDVIELLKTLIAPNRTVAFIEEVGGFIGKQQPGSSMFKFGRSFGLVLGAVQALGVRVELVRPRKWQAPLALGTASSCATQSEWKRKLRSCAQRLHPGLKPTLKTADALLILEFALKSCGLR
jgi:hypothetical protein